MHNGNAHQPNNGKFVFLKISKYFYLYFFIVFKFINGINFPKRYKYTLFY